MAWKLIETDPAPDEGVFLIFRAACPWPERQLMVERAEAKGPIRIYMDDQIVDDATHWAPLLDPPAGLDAITGKGG